MELLSEDIKKYVEFAKKHKLNVTEKDILFLWSFQRSIIHKELEKHSKIWNQKMKTE